MKPRDRAGLGARRLAFVVVVLLLGSFVSAGGAGGAGGRGAGTQHYYTTAGALDESQVGDVLAHHHIFVELGAVPPVAYLDPSNTPEKVYSLRWPLDEGCQGPRDRCLRRDDALGRWPAAPDLVKYVADQSGLPTMLVTGIYREPFMPDWVYDASVGQIADFMLNELRVGVADTGVPAGIIKLSRMQRA